MNMIFNKNKNGHSGADKETGEQSHYWEEAIEAMGAEMRPFVALMEELLPTEQIAMAATPGAAQLASKTAKRRRWFSKK